jgi:hypothetical protein
LLVATLHKGNNNMKALRYPSTYIYAPYASAAGMLLNKNRKFTAVNRKGFVLKGIAVNFYV